MSRVISNATDYQRYLLDIKTEELEAIKEGGNKALEVTVADIARTAPVAAKAYRDRRAKGRVQPGRYRAGITLNRITYARGSAVKAAGKGGLVGAIRYKAWYSAIVQWRQRKQHGDTHAEPALRRLPELGREYIDAALVAAARRIG